MHPLEIRAELLRRGYTLSAVARECGVTPSAVSQVVNNSTPYKGYRVRKAIAGILSLPEERIWPSQHQSNDRLAYPPSKGKHHLDRRLG